MVTYTSDLQNSTICFHHVNEKTLSQYWPIPPEVLYGIVQYIMLTSSLEFIVAQAPYSMRGLLFGIFTASLDYQQHWLHSALDLTL